MKTKAKSYRFDENDLALAMAKSGISKTQQLMDFLLGEYVRDLKPQYASLHKDFSAIKNTWDANPSNPTARLILDEVGKLAVPSEEVVAKYRAAMIPPIPDQSKEERLKQLEKGLADIPDKTKGLGKKLAEHLQKKINTIKSGSK